MFGVQWRGYYTIPRHAAPFRPLSKRKAQTVAFLMLLAGWEVPAGTVKLLGQPREPIVLKRVPACR